MNSITPTLPIRRWIIRTIAFTAILSYGIFIVSSHKSLGKLLNVAFDVVPLQDGASNNHHRHFGFRPPRYYKHIMTKKMDNFQYSQGGSSNNMISNNATSIPSASDDGIRISFQLHDPKTVPLTNVFNLYVKCDLGEVTATIRKNKVPTGEIRSGELPSSLVKITQDEKMRDSIGYTRSGRVLDFTTTISTDLKLLLIGDSVMIQLAQSFDEQLGAKELQTRYKLWDAWSGHDGGTVVAPTHGGGISATYRMTGLLSLSRKGKQPANAPGGGWSDKEIDAFKSFSYPTAGQVHNATLGNFDVVVYRVMHGWMKIHEITHERLIESIELAGTLLGAKTVVLMTIPFTNNVLTYQEWNQCKKMNEDMRIIAREWHKRVEYTGNVKNVLVLEYGTYYNHVIWSNAQHLGYNVTHPLQATEYTFNAEGPSFLYDRLNVDGWAASIPMVCSDMSSLGSERKTCNRNYLFSDGMHICSEKLASRYGAGLACLIGCVYNNDSNEATNVKTNHTARQDGIRACERECNEQFLSVMPVEESLIDTNTTIASFSN